MSVERMPSIQAAEQQHREWNEPFAVTDVAAGQQDAPDLERRIEDPWGAGHQQMRCSYEVCCRRHTLADVFPVQHKMQHVLLIIQGLSSKHC